MNTHIGSLLSSDAPPRLSYEFFPPKTDKGRDNLAALLPVLAETNPDFTTITYGAGGSTQAASFAIAELLQQAGMRPVMPHLTCVGATKAELEIIINGIHARGHRNIMALRGDPPAGETAFTVAKDGLANARDLVALIKATHADICCGVAGYPETHPEASSPEAELDYLKAKMDAGADFITTQLFFNNRHYFDFVERCQQAGITIPILPGLLPAVSLPQVERFTKLCQAEFPEELRSRMEAAGDAAEAVEEVGIEWAAAQADDLLAHGAPGMHLYILNRRTAATHPAIRDVVSRHCIPPST